MRCVITEVQCNVLKSYCVWDEDLPVIGVCMLCVLVHHSQWPVADQHTLTIHNVVLNNSSKKFHFEVVEKVPYHSVTFPV